MQEFYRGHPDASLPLPESGHDTLLKQVRIIAILQDSIQQYPNLPELALQHFLSMCGKDIWAARTINNWVAYLQNSIDYWLQNGRKIGHLQWSYYLVNSGLPQEFGDMLFTLLVAKAEKESEQTVGSGSHWRTRGGSITMVDYLRRSLSGWRKPRAHERLRRNGNGEIIAVQEVQLPWPLQRKFVQFGVAAVNDYQLNWGGASAVLGITLNPDKTIALQSQNHAWQLLAEGEIPHLAPLYSPGVVVGEGNYMLWPYQKQSGATATTVTVASQLASMRAIRPRQSLQISVTAKGVTVRCTT